MRKYLQKINFVTRKDGKGTQSGLCCPPDSGCMPSSVLTQSTCCAGELKELPRWATGTVTTPAGVVMKVSTDWSRADHWGMIRSRINSYRMKYAVVPGLYAVGEPNKDSDVFISANYKLSFDVLRRELKGLNAWILVLDTKSINVWCAAGKGTFGTDELVRRIADAHLGTVVSHRRIIVPQLGAVGVSASAVQKRAGFCVHFGPVAARDIPAYVRAGYKKTKKMSIIEFSILDRLVLTPMEVNPVTKKYPWFAAVILLLFGLQPSGILFEKAWAGGAPFLLLGLVSVLAGAFITPVLLPFVPFRSFAIKGWLVGMLSVLSSVQVFGLVDRHNTIMFVVAYLFFPAASSYIALQFTGSTTFTGMSGVKKELKIGIPAYIVTAGISLLLMVLFKLREWGFI
jgi:hypothetical protein